MTRKWLFNALLSVTILVTLAIIVTMFFAAQEGVLTLNIGDTDYSDSWFAWVIAFPVLVVTCVAAVFITIIALLGSLVLLLACVAMGLVMAVCGILMGLAPIVAFLAVPVLAIYGLVKLLQPKTNVAQSVAISG